MQRCAQGGATRRWFVHVSLSRCALACAALCAGLAAQAQTGPALEAVTVRARLVEEAAREVPFTVDVLDGQALEERGLYSLEDALRAVPGVEVNSYGDTANTNVRIRGMGALQKVSGEDSSVTFSMDGLPMTIGNVTTATFDVERVEVLKGPQGTLFGTNSEAGAINVITRKPTRHFEGYVRGEAGQEGQRMFEGAVSGPLGDVWSARLAVRGTASDNVVRDEASDAPLSRPRDGAVRGALLWQPTAATRLTLGAQHESLRRHASMSALRPYGDHPVMEATPYTDRDRKTADRFWAVLEHDLDFARLTSLTGYARSTFFLPGNPYEGTLFRRLLGEAPQGGYFAFDQAERGWSQELRLASRPEDAVFWVAGLHLRHGKRRMDMPGGADAYYLESPYNADIYRSTDHRSRALFGEAMWPVAESLKLTAGLRHTWERKRYDATWAASATNPSPGREVQDHDHLTDRYTTGRMALTWAATAQTSLYGVAARGYKSGGYNDSGTNIAAGGRDLPYGPARVRSLELGVKHERADGRLGLSAAVFHNQGRGDHVLVFDTLTFSTQAENMDTRSKGLEVSGFWKPGAGLTVTGGLALTRATITGIPAASVAEAAVGNRVPDSPRWSGSLAVAHRMPIAAFFGLASPVLQTQLTARLVGDRAADPQNSFLLPRYHQLDLRVGVAGGNAEFYLWGRNLTSQRYDLYGYYYPPYYEGGPDATIGMPSRGRTLGVGVGMAWYF